MTGVSKEKNKYGNMLSEIWKPLSPPFTCHPTCQDKHCLPIDHLHSPLKINKDNCFFIKERDSILIVLWLSLCNNSIEGYIGTYNYTPFFKQLYSTLKKGKNKDEP